MNGYRDDHERYHKHGPSTDDERRAMTCPACGHPATAHNPRGRCDICADAAQVGTYAPCAIPDTTPTAPVADLPPGAIVDDDPDGLAAELTAAYVTATTRRDRWYMLRELARQYVRAANDEHPAAVTMPAWTDRLAARATLAPNGSRRHDQMAAEMRDEAARHARHWRHADLARRIETDHPNDPDTRAYLRDIIAGRELADPEDRQRRLHEHYDDAYGTADGRWSRLDGRTMADR